MTTAWKGIVDWPGGVATLASNITAADTTITLSYDPGTAMSTTDFIIQIGFEQIVVVSRAGAVLTCTDGRGANGTTAAAHYAGDTVEQNFVAAHLTAVRAAINALENQTQKLSSSGNLLAGMTGVDLTLSGALAVNNGAITSTTNIIITPSASLRLDTPVNAGDNGLTGMMIRDTTAYAVGVGGRFALYGKATAAGAYYAFAAVKGSKVNGTDGNYAGDMLLQTRAHGAGLATALALRSTLNAEFYGDIVLADAKNVQANTTTGSKIGTASNQKLGFWNASPVVQPAAVTDASGGSTVDAEARAAINTLLARLRAAGLIAT